MHIAIVVALNDVVYIMIEINTISVLPLSVMLKLLSYFPW